MGLFSMLLGLPLVPVRGVVAVAGVIQEQAERELYDPTQIRRQIEETDAAVEAGELSEEEAARQQEQILEPAIEPAPEAAAAGEEQEEEDTAEQDTAEEDTVKEER
jgi:hypothetical protein